MYSHTHNRTNFHAVHSLARALAKLDWTDAEMEFRALAGLPHLDPFRGITAITLSDSDYAKMEQGRLAYVAVSYRHITHEYNPLSYRFECITFAGEHKDFGRPDYYGLPGDAASVCAHDWSVVGTPKRSVVKLSGGVYISGERVGTTIYPCRSPKGGV